MVRKFAFSGKANAGKNAAASILAKHLNVDDSSIFAFADAVKRVALAMFPQINSNHLWGPSHLRAGTILGYLDEEENPLTYRRLLQDVGKLGRSYHPDMWVLSTFRYIEKCSEKQTDPVAIISDVRFRNELSALQQNGFFTCRIIRKDNPSKMTDISEVDLDETPDSSFDYVIHNDGDLQVLEEKIKEMLVKV